MKGKMRKEVLLPGGDRLHWLAIRSFSQEFQRVDWGFCGEMDRHLNALAWNDMLMQTVLRETAPFYEPIKKGDNHAKYTGLYM